MQLSRFVVVYEGVREDENVLYDVAADRYLGVNDEVLAFARRLDAGGVAQDEEEQEMAELLSAQHFLVADRAADDRRLQAHLAEVAKGIPGTVTVTLLPTLACNLACSYCFQKESPAFNRMSAANEEKSLAFILDKVDAAAASRLVVHYFGGEPLTRKDYVLRTAGHLSAAMTARGGTFAWELTTNGVELDLLFVNAMNKLGNGAIKVTLDGDKATHDQARRFRGGKGSFDRIFSNLVKVAGSVRLSVGGNFYPGEEASYERLIDRLEEAGVASKLDALKFKPVLDVTPSELTPSHGSTCSTCTAGPKQEAEMLTHIDRLVNLKLPGKSGTLQLLRGPCELHWENHYVLDPDGLVYRCPAVAGRPEVAVGSVQGGPLRSAPLLDPRPWEQHAPCHDCAFLPTCMGGCLGSQYLKTGRTDQVLCKKEWFEARFREVIPRRYLQELGAAHWDGDQEAVPNPKGGLREEEAEAEDQGEQRGTAADHALHVPGLLGATDEGGAAEETRPPARVDPLQRTAERR